MENRIKPIQTNYKGHRFRSRLEARWAVFFDAIGADWEYEPEGYIINDKVCYLPDFVLYDVPSGHVQNDDDGLADRKVYKKLWIEVKGVMDEESAQKIREFSRSLDKDESILVVGAIPFGADFFDGIYEDMWNKHSIIEPQIYYYQLGGEWAGGDLDYLGADETGKAGVYGGYKWWSRVGLDYKKTQEAYNEALSARFEHGEKG